MCPGSSTYLGANVAGFVRSRKDVAGFVRSRKKYRGPGSHEPSYEEGRRGRENNPDPVKLTTLGKQAGY